MSLIAATATFTPGNIRGVLDLYVQVKLFAAVKASQAIIVEQAQAICPVDTGALRDSIAPTDITDESQQVTGGVVATMPYAAFVEFGTGQRGAASPGAGPFTYGPRKGMPAQPYMRPALDTARDQVLAEFKS